MGVPADIEVMQATALSGKVADITEKLSALDAAMNGDKGACTACEAKYYREVVFSAMEALRAVVDETELMMPTAKWPYPSYGEMLFSVR